MARTFVLRFCLKVLRSGSLVHVKEGVVVVEDLKRLKSVLRLPNQSPDTLLEALNELSKKIPPKHILQETKIGHTVNRLTKHENKEVSTKAAHIVKTWKKFFVEKMERPLIEVKCDKKTDALREAGRKHLQRVMVCEDGKSKARLCEVIEREVFHHHRNLVDRKYRKMMRSIIFSIEHKTELRQAVLSGEIDAKKLIVMHAIK